MVEMVELMGTPLWTLERPSLQEICIIGGKLTVELAGDVSNLVNGFQGDVDLLLNLNGGFTTEDVVPL